MSQLPAERTFLELSYKHLPITELAGTASDSSETHEEHIISSEPQISHKGRLASAEVSCSASAFTSSNFLDYCSTFTKETKIAVRQESVLVQYASESQCIWSYHR